LPKLHRAVALAAALLVPGSGMAGDIKAGRQKAVQCQACHGADGIAKLPEAANLAGQTEVYLLKALGEFKSGARKNEMMSLVIQGLSPKDMEDLAAYFAAFEVQVTPPPK